jgi:hypothetical protein
MRLSAGLALAIACLHSPLVRAADITDVATAFDEGNPFDFRFRVRYDHTEKRAQIKRELEGLSASQDRLLIFKDLLYQQHRDTLTMRAEAGLFQDLMVHFELPIIISEVEDYKLDQSEGNNCIYPPAANPNCVNKSNSTTIADGIVPPNGFDAQHMGAGFTGADTMIFRGVQRGANGGSGADAFDTLNVGLTWAPLNQRRDDTKPTWIVGIEGQFSVGNIKAFNRIRPDANHAVSEGIHRLIAHTAISHKFRYFDPYIGLWYMYPIARDSSLFQDYGPAQKQKNPMQQGGTRFGFEAIVFERPEENHRIAFDFRGRLEAHFNGKGYSEAWELIAASPALRCDASVADFNPACDPSQATNKYQGQPYTGITTIENYATLGADAALTAQVGRYVHFRFGFDYSHDSSHLITNEDIGTPSTASGRVTMPQEFNPAYRAVVDQPGRRLRVDNVDVYNAYIWLQIMF